MASAEFTCITIFVFSHCSNDLLDYMLHATLLRSVCVSKQPYHGERICLPKISREQNKFFIRAIESAAQILEDLNLDKCNRNTFVALQQPAPVTVRLHSSVGVCRPSPR